MVLEWKELSDPAKNILEWMENPYTGNIQTLNIVNGGYFKIGSRVNQFISNDVFNEILSYCKGRDDYNSEITEGAIKVRLNMQNEEKQGGR